MKGILAFKDEPRRYVLQGVHRITDLRPADAWGQENPVSKLVFIGRNLDKAALDGALRACLC
jgi:G3E family GTPase